jgi:Ca2+-transporting ATPase
MIRRAPSRVFFNTEPAGETSKPHGPSLKAIEETPAWHTLSAAAVTRQLVSDLDGGLSSAEAARRLVVEGPNEIRERRPRSIFRMVVSQFQDFMILVLIAAAFVSGAIGEAGDAVIILAIVVLNGAIGFVQDYRAESVMAALRQLAALKAIVVRDGRRHAIAAAEIVRGDVVLIEAGNGVPADLRLVEAPRLKINEAALTGEAIPAEKRADPLADAGLPVADQLNMAFKGTVVTYGRGRGIAVATGMATQLGRIAGLLEAVEPAQAPLQRRLAVFGRQLAVAILAICAVFFALGIWRGEPLLLMLLTALSLAVAAIPEALPAVITMMLALGARAMARRNALVRRLPAVETLGSVSFICTDKTGTLTLNEMRAKEVYVSGERRVIVALQGADAPAKALVVAAALCNDAERGAHGEVIGDPTEVALWRLAAEAGLEPETLRRTAPRLLELPFDSDRKRMTTVHREGDGPHVVAYTKGAPETVLDRCETEMGSEADLPANRGRALAIAEAMADEGLRVLAVARRRWTKPPEGETPDEIERDLTLIGLVGLLDPPRPEAKAAVALCKTAGITPIMITGDHPATARSIAGELGISRPGDRIITGRELHGLSDAALAERIEGTSVFARVDPAQKIRIVSALQARGQFVAMTGDGVNDAPALAQADIGVAMGKSGTDVAREAASLVLLDDNFATIVAAIAEGRRIFENIRKFISYVLTSNAAEILTLFLAPFFGLPIPLLPVHILWINLITDGLPGLALAAEPPEKGAMRRPPRPPGESIFARGMWQHILAIGLIMAGVCLATQAYSIHLALPHWQTMVFTVLTLSQMGNVLAIRSERESLFRQGLFTNLPLCGAVLLTFGLQMATIYVPVLNPIFRTAPLTMPELAVCMALSSVVFFVIEIEKYLARRGFIYRE